MPRKRYDWADLKELAAKNTTIAEIAKIKGCEWLTVKFALLRMGIEPPGKKHLKEKRKLEKAEAELAPTPIPSASELLELECSECKQPLTIVPWNQVTRMAFCVNPKCRLCHMPIMHPSLKVKVKNKEGKYFENL